MRHVGGHENNFIFGQNGWKVVIFILAAVVAAIINDTDIYLLCLVYEYST